MKISKRLEAIASLIPDNSTVIDVGCDHALLDIYLAQEKNCECIATDINKNALDQAKYNISRFHVTKVKTVLTDGLKGIPIRNTDIVVISGMGTGTINHILTIENLPNRLLISSHTDFEDLRRNVVSLGYFIQDEKYVEEKGKAYIIMDFMSGKREYSPEDYQFGPILKKNLHFIENEESKIKEILSHIPNSDTEFETKKEILNQLQKLKNTIT